MTSTAPRRSDATRAAILRAAILRFAAEGYERATIRAIAADAGIDPAMVMRYYGSKDGLFAAASQFDLGLPDLSGTPRNRVGEALVTHFLDRWEDDEALFALLRAAATNEAAAERTRGIFADQLCATVSSLYGPDTPAAEVAQRAGLISTQMLGLAMCRYVLHIPPVLAMDRATIVAWLEPTIQRYLTAPMPEGPAAASA